MSDKKTKRGFNYYKNNSTCTKKFVYLTGCFPQ